MKIQVTEREVGSLVAKAINRKLDRITVELYDEIDSACYLMEECRNQYIGGVIEQLKAIKSYEYGNITDKMIKQLKEFKENAHDRETALKYAAERFCCTDLNLLEMPEEGENL